MPRKMKMSPRRRRVARRRRAVRRKTNVPDKASCSVVVPLADINTNVAYNFETFRLSDSARASAISKGYQQYRIANIRLTWKPLYDTYAPGGVGGVTKPVLYHMVDAARAIPDTFTLANLKEMGVRPRSLDEKPIQVNWKPAVLIDTPTVGASVVRYAPWLTTNENATVPGASWAPSAVQHAGIKFFIESADGATNTPVEIQVEYQIEFKKPNWSSSSSTEALGMVLA